MPKVSSRFQLSNNVSIFLSHLLALIYTFFSDFYVMYAEMEEKYGSARNIMSVYDKAVNAVLPEEKYEVIIQKAIL